MTVCRQRVTAAAVTKIGDSVYNCIWQGIMRKKTIKRRRPIRAVAAVLVLIAILGATAVIYINRIVVAEGMRWIVTEDEARAFRVTDCILVLGAGVYNNKYPSAMLEDRLEEGIRLYNLGVSDRLLMSGDNGAVNYNEVKVMKDYAVRAGVPGEHIFQDHAGFSTYESMYRARDIFAAQSIVVVTQEYHLYRALYVAHALGLDAVGVTSDPRAHAGQSLRDVREMIARVKDYVYCVIKPLPTFLGEVIPVNGDGSVTD